MKGQHNEWNIMKKCLLLILGIYCTVATSTAQQKVIDITPSSEADNRNIEIALEKAASYKGKPVTIRLSTGIYDLSRSEAIKKSYYVSNTTSESENPDPTKHIGILLKQLKNVTIDGCGSTLLATGLITNFVLDQCENITFKNLSIDSSDPAQTEMEILENGNDYLIAKVHSTSHYQVENGKIRWKGDGWAFEKGIAQSYDREKDITWRSWSPMSGLTNTVELRPGMLYLQYKQKPNITPHTVFQMRDGIRNEVCGLVNASKNIRFENVNFFYLGNFGVVCQSTENVTFKQTNFSPKPGSGRTNAGYADFIQVSGCKGKVQIMNSKFSGAHDDPINVHGTHLKVVDFISPKQIKVRYMHPQTYGFSAFLEGDEIELVNTNSLLCIEKAKVVKAQLINPREMILTLNHALHPTTTSDKDIVVENITWTPEVEIINNDFSRIPTRGILVSTRRKILIEGNTFYGMQMSGILVANDALSWYESGPVYDLTIRRNTFIDCGNPVILIHPENKVFNGIIHKNITIEENVFDFKTNKDNAIEAKATKSLIIRRNLFKIKEDSKYDSSDLIKTKDCENVIIEGNTIYKDIKY